jgi:hypothetical protein
VFVTYVRDKGSANLFPWHLCNIYLPLITADVFVTYVRDKGSTNLFPGHLYYIDLSLYSWCVCNLC